VYIDDFLPVLSKLLMHVAENYWFNGFFGLWTFRNYAACFWAKCEEPCICQTEK